MDNYIKIGRLNKNNLGKYKRKITTDEVILTYEREQHIKEKHNGDYSELRDYIQSTIYCPDYVLQDMGHNETIIILKHLIKEDIRIKMIIKLYTNKMINKMNSIITFWKIRKRDYEKTIAKSEIIYQRLDKNE